MAIEAESLSPLAELQVLLHQCGYSTYLTGAEDEEPVEQLLLDLRDEPGVKPLAARLLWLEELEQDMLARSGRAPEPPADVWHLEILVQLPLDCPPEKQ